MFTDISLLYTLGPPFQRVFVVGEQTVHFRPQTDEFQRRVAVAFVFHFTYYLRVLAGLQEMIAGIGGRVQQMTVLQHVAVNVVGEYLITEAVRVAEKQPRVGAVSLEHHVKVKIKDQRF